ncbi:MAG: UDP-N-acetylglucosamine 1-carboxyvinyltransferase [Deltaproteobacteria bacterium]|nr:UDP-N-acetylglucosamine 1-carboxyvinyltransferase [Deltaproteobacteria bacterium]
MDTFIIEGGNPLSGTITVEGNKNAALPMVAAILLSEEAVTLDNVPRIRDVLAMSRILQDLGVDVDEEGKNRWRFCAKNINSHAPNPGLCQQIRASFALAGPLLGRLGKAHLPSPGGDRIGRRPLETHLKAFEALGVEVKTSPDGYELEAKGGLKGAEIFLEEMSVLATENVIMAASLAKGPSVIRNCASEPHVQDLCNMLVSMGSSIEGIGTSTLHIEGKDKLHGVSVEVGPDYIEVGSFIALGAITGGDLRIKKARPTDHRMTKVAFGRLGITWEEDGDDIYVPKGQQLEAQSGAHGAVCRIHDAPWPGFPADLTSIATVLATQVKGTVLIHEWMYESRLFWVDRLISMGARIVMCDPHRALVEGPAQLYGKTLSSPDIRAGMSLVLAALVAEGRSVIQNAQQIDRGYADIEQRLSALGANIQRV